MHTGLTAYTRCWFFQVAGAQARGSPERLSTRCLAWAPKRMRLQVWECWFWERAKEPPRLEARRRSLRASSTSSTTSIEQIPRTGGGWIRNATPLQPRACPPSCCASRVCSCSRQVPVENASKAWDQVTMQHPSRTVRTCMDMTLLLCEMRCSTETRAGFHYFIRQSCSSMYRVKTHATIHPQGTNTGWSPRRRASCDR